jgi:PAS domain S-box-containing protein
VIVQKISYVQQFKPWQWVIGTGIYVQDVQASILAVQRNLIYISLGIAVAIALLLLYAGRQSFGIEKRRASAEKALKESHEKYRTLAEASTDGVLMSLEGRSAYYNKPILDMLGYSGDELSEMRMSNLFVNETEADEQALQHVEDLANGEPAPSRFEARLRGKDGQPVDVLLTPTPISLADKRGFVLVARSVGGQKAMEAALDETRRQFRTMSNAISLGVFRSTWGRKATLVDANPAMKRIMGLAPNASVLGTDWVDRITDPDERTALIARLTRDKMVENYHLALRREDGGRSEVSLFAALVDGEEDGLPVNCEGILEDITKQQKGEEERENLISQLQTSLFFLQEPITKAVVPALTLDMNQPISRAAALMNKTGSDVVLVTGPKDELMGILTDHDFRERVVATGLDYSNPIRSIMTSPVASISPQGRVHEALLRMQERRVQHLAVVDGEDPAVGMLHLRDLAKYQQSSSVVIADSVRRARSVEEITEAHDKVPALVKASVESGATTRYVSRIITGVSDEIALKLLAMATERLGPPPARFAFLTLGSEGREEQTLLTDQDNAILYEDPPEEKKEETGKYFLELGNLVCDWLDEIGYAFCDGGVMAKNPRWNQPL